MHLEIIQMADLCNQFAVLLQCCNHISSFGMKTLSFLLITIFPLAKFTLLHKGCLTVWPWHAVYEFYMLLPRMEFGEAIMKERWEAFGEKKIHYFFPESWVQIVKGNSASQYGQSQSEKSEHFSTSTTTASNYIPKRPRICINWNPPFQTSLHKIFKNGFLLGKSCFTMFTFSGIFAK